MTGSTDARMGATTTAEPLLRANKVTMRFGGLVANRDVDFEIPHGSIVSLIGPNGAGKTTFFNQLTGMLEPTAGDIVFDGDSIVGLTPHEIVERGIGRTFQNIRLFGAMTVLANVMVGRHTRMKASWWASLLKLPAVREEEEATRRRARELLKLVGLPRRYEEDWAKNLPYGDQRRLELARALASDPKLLLLDEPTAGMNPGETAQMTALIKRLRDELDLTVLLIEHDMKVVMGISERITVLDYGEKLAEGAPEEIRANPAVIEAYLGKQATSA
jgi:branched-chain amino acid transport system ATP-binding protein